MKPITVPRGVSRPSGSDGAVDCAAAAGLAAGGSGDVWAERRSAPAKPRVKSSPIRRCTFEFENDAGATVDTFLSLKGLEVRPGWLLHCT